MFWHISLTLSHKINTKRKSQPSTLFPFSKKHFNLPPIISILEFDIKTLITNFTYCTQFQQGNLSWYELKLLKKRIHHVLKLKNFINHKATQIVFGKRKAQNILDRANQIKPNLTITNLRKNIAKLKKIKKEIEKLFQKDQEKLLKQKIKNKKKEANNSRTKDKSKTKSKTKTTKYPTKK